jgi:hypothetical protein
MTKPTKAVLISVLVFPGAGHFFLRRWLWWLLFMVPALALAATIILVDYGLERALDAADKILSGQVAPDYQSIQMLLTQPLDPMQAFILGTAQFLLIVCWIGAAIDSRIKAGEDVSQSPQSTSAT